MNYTKTLIVLIILTFQNIYSQSDYPKGKLVSLIDLTINPKKYYGKKITVKGYLSLKKETEGLFINKEDANYNILRNGIGIVGVGEFDDKYVIISGTFTKNVELTKELKKALKKNVIKLNNNNKLYLGYLSKISFIEDLNKW